MGSASRALAVPPPGRARRVPAAATRASCRCSRAPCARIEGAVQRGTVKPSVRTKFQVVALLVREERARVRAQGSGSEANRAEQLVTWW